MIRIENPLPGVRVLTLDRPAARNAFNRALYDATTQALTAARADDACKVVVLTGTGSAFSAGQDVAEMVAIAQRHATGGIGERSSGFPQLLAALVEFDKPLIAAVNGAAVGLGFTLLPHADIVLIAESARFRVPFAEFGVPPEAASSYLLPQRIGWQRAAAVLLTGEWVSSAEAVEWGLAIERVPDRELLSRALSLAERIATASLESLRAIKLAMQDWQRPLIDRAMATEASGYAANLGTATVDAIRSGR